jgi:hypothetical protein
VIVVSEWCVHGGLSISVVGGHTEGKGDGVGMVSAWCQHVVRMVLKWRYNGGRIRLILEQMSGWC